MNGEFREDGEVPTGWKNGVIELEASDTSWCGIEELQDASVRDT